MHKPKDTLKDRLRAISFEDSIYDEPLLRLSEVEELLENEFEEKSVVIKRVCTCAKNPCKHG